MEQYDDDEQQTKSYGESIQSSLCNKRNERLTASPIRTTQFLRRRIKVRTQARISASRPNTGSSNPSVACWVKSTPTSDRVGVLADPVPPPPVTSSRPDDDDDDLSSCCRLVMSVSQNCRAEASSSSTLRATSVCQASLSLLVLSSSSFFVASIFCLPLYSSNAKTIWCE